MRRPAIFALLLLLLSGLCANAESAHHIIIDSDTAGDDAMAIALAVCAENIDVEGITVLAGNVSLAQGAKNALQVLETLGRGDIPVYLGADTTYDGTKRVYSSVYGTDGMGDAGLICPEGEAQAQSATDFIIETAKKYPGEIEIVCIGPATNIAFALEKDPEAMAGVKRIWLMGTSGFGVGNATPLAEFNVYVDAAAYDVLLRSGLPITVVGLDMCELEGNRYTSAQLEAFAGLNDATKFLATGMGVYMSYRQETEKLDDVDVCDAVCMMALARDGFVLEKTNCAADIVTDKDCPAYGAVLFYRENCGYENMPEATEYNVEVVARVNEAEFHNYAAEILCGN